MSPEQQAIFTAILNAMRDARRDRRRLTELRLCPRDWRQMLTLDPRYGIEREEPEDYGDDDTLTLDGVRLVLDYGCMTSLAHA
jgi:hypothetical protein